MKNFLFILISSLLLFAGCSNSGRKEKNAKLYVDLLVLEESSKLTRDSLRSEEAKLFEKYNLSKAKYLSDMKSYEENDWDEFFKLARSYMDTLKARDSIK